MVGVFCVGGIFVLLCLGFLNLEIKRWRWRERKMGGQRERKSGSYGGCGASRYTWLFWLHMLDQPRRGMSMIH